MTPAASRYQERYMGTSLIRNCFPLGPGPVVRAETGDTPHDM